MSTKGVGMNEKHRLLRQFVKEQFVPGSVAIEDLPDGAVRITDKKEAIILTIDLKTKEIRDADGILRGNL